MKKIILSIAFVCTAICLQAQSMTPKDAQFAADANQAGLLEIKLAELSITHASSDSVKILGQQMILDHTKANDQLKALAVSKNISLPLVLNDAGQARYDSLAKFSGRAFDKAYVHQLVSDHKKAIELFKNEETSGSDDDLKTWSAVTLPVLKHHLMTSKDLSVDLGAR